MLATGEWQARAHRLGAVFEDALAALVRSGLVDAVRCRGLWAGVDVSRWPARTVCEALLHRGVLAKDAHEHTVRLAPPLVITEDELSWAVRQLRDVLIALTAGGMAAAS